MAWRQLFQFAEYQLNPYSIPPFITALLIASLGSFVLAKDPRKGANRSFFGFGLCLSIWLFGYGLILASPNEEIASIWLQWVYAGVTFIPAFGYDTSVRVTSRGMTSPYPQVLAGVFYGISTCFYLLIFFRPDYFFIGWKNYFWGRSPLYGPAGVLFLIYFLVGMILSLLVCRQNLRRTKVMVHRNQIRYSSIGIFVGYLGGVDFLSKFGLPIYPIGYLPIFILFSIFSYAIIQHHLMDIQTRIHKTLMGAVLSTLLLVPCLGIVIVIWPWLQKLPSWTIWASGPVFLALTILYFRALYPIIDHLFQQGADDLQETSRHLSEKLTVGNIQKLEKEIVQILMETLHIDQIHFLILDEKKNGYYPIAINGALPDRSIAANDPFIRWVDDHPILIEAKTLRENSFSPEIKEASEAFFTRSGATLCIPLKGGSGLLGLISLKSKKDRQPLNEIDMEFLERFRREGSLALERLYAKRKGTGLDG